MQLRLDEMAQLYEADSQNAFADYLRRMPVSVTSSTARASGASLPLQSVTFSGVPQSNPTTAFDTTISGTLTKKTP